LWRVPDAATRELMLEFYRRVWVRKETIGAALRGAKSKLRSALDERGEPIYATGDWAGWVASGRPD
jgi:CHAT domain-containing protein